MKPGLTQPHLPSLKPKDLCLSTLILAEPSHRKWSGAINPISAIAHLPDFQLFRAVIQQIPHHLATVRFPPLLRRPGFLVVCQIYGFHWIFRGFNQFRDNLLSKSDALVVGQWPTGNWSWRLAFAPRTCRQIDKASPKRFIKWPCPVIAIISPKQSQPKPRCDPKMPESFVHRGLAGDFKGGEDHGGLGAEDVRRCTLTKATHGVGFPTASLAKPQRFAVCWAEEFSQIWGPWGLIFFPNQLLQPVLCHLSMAELRSPVLHAGTLATRLGMIVGRLQWPCKLAISLGD